MGEIAWQFANPARTGNHWDVSLISDELQAYLDGHSGALSADAVGGTPIGSGVDIGGALNQEDDLNEDQAQKLDKLVTDSGNIWSKVAGVETSVGHIWDKLADVETRLAAQDGDPAALANLTNALGRMETVLSDPTGGVGAMIVRLAAMVGALQSAQAGAVDPAAQKQAALEAAQEVLANSTLVFKPKEN